MQTKFKDIYINYETLGDKGDWIVFLHGWAGSIESFEIIAKHFQSTNSCLLIDFPPFGKSEEPYEVWDINTYEQLLLHITDILQIKTFSIVAHSFGGRVAIKFASDYNEKVDKLLLVDSAGIKPRFNIIKYLKVKKYKLAKKLKLKTSQYGSADYQQLTPLMKKTFVNIVNFDVSPLLKQIVCGTLIINGKNDTETPLYMAKKLNRKIANSALIVFDDCGHFSYIEDYERFIAISKSFLKG